MSSQYPRHHRRHQHGNSVPEIPLQDLDATSGAHGQPDLDRRSSHRRTRSERGKALFRGSRDKRAAGLYTSLDETSPPPTARTTQSGRPSAVAFVTSPSGQHQRLADEDEEAILADPGAFQQAIGFAGLSYNVAAEEPVEESDSDAWETPSKPMRANRARLPRIQTMSDDPSMVAVQLDDGPAFFSPGAADEDDTVPLTGPSSSRQRVSALLSPTSPRTRVRTSGLHVPFKGFSGRRSEPGIHNSNSRLGDDLHAAESGFSNQQHSRESLRESPGRGRGRAHSVLAGSPLQRTSTMLRNMSQRVVNVSNESELVERDIRRKQSVVSRDRSSSRERTPSVGGDGVPSAASPSSEKEAVTTTITRDADETPVVEERNPLRGNALGIISPENPLRRRLLDILVSPWFEPLILLLIITQTVILTIDSAPSVYDHPRRRTWGGAWPDYCLFGIFVIYTIEIGIKLIVSGFIFNPRQYSTIDRSIGFREAVYKKAGDLFALHRRPTVKKPNGDDDEPPPQSSLLRSFTGPEEGEIPGSSRQAQKKRLAHRAFLRHSFNRLDFVAVVSYWISFVLAITALEYDRHIFVFRMLSCLRIVRLLGITSGTSVILRSLKRAAPTLLNVAFLIGFFWLLFAIIGVQSFKSSLGRTCVWNYDNTVPGQSPYAQNQTYQFQFCGSWLAANGSEMPYLLPDGSWGEQSPKGFACPVGSVCLEGPNPYNGTVSYDNILQSAELVFVVMTSNTFTDLMYYLMNSDFMAAALFSAFGIVILMLWLLNLLIAVITSSLHIIREESRSSAFTAEGRHSTSDDESRSEDNRPPSRTSTIKKMYDSLHWVWIAVIIFGLVVQCLRNETMQSSTSQFITVVELSVTLILLGEIIFRFVADWRGFRHSIRNWVDLGLVIITCVIQLPPIRNSGAPYAWLTVFQIVRIYRVVLAIKMTSDLIRLVFRQASGLLNLILFVFLLTFLAAIFAVQLFRGELPFEDGNENELQIQFSTIYNAFLGMYQLLSSENWTTVLYNVTRFEEIHHTAWIGATFLILWYILSNFIVLNMFIAVIQENFDVSEDQKRLQQVRMFLQQKELGTNSVGTLSLSSIFKFGLIQRQDPLDYGSAATEMLLKEQVVKDFLNDMEELDADVKPSMTRTGTNFVQKGNGRWQRAWNWAVNKVMNPEPNPFYARLQLSKAYEDLDPRTLAKEVMEATERRKVTQREYLRRHPMYNTSLYIFKPDHPVRKFCQRIVGSGRGSERYEGVAPNPTVWYATSAFIYAAVVAMVLLACVTTPLYQREWFEKRQDFTRFNWFVLSDMAFAALFTVEAVIKVIADGFFWTPNAYFRSSWGFIDFVVLVTLWSNVIASLYDPGGGSRAVGAFKALRALRLLNVSDSARDTFHSVIVLGGWQVISASFVSLSLLVPFAMYGLNLFAGQMYACNDLYSGIYNLTDCVGEYMSSPYNWNFPAPRVPSNSYYDFDDFPSALFILFQIVSQEGWIDVMNSAEDITGVFTQPRYFASQGNALFFVAFNLLGAVFVLTLFVSVFMRNYTEQTGVAFLTVEQRSWLELRKLLRQIAPSKRPKTKRQREGWQEWCYRRAITKSGRWYQAITTLLVVDLILLCLEWYPNNNPWLRARTLILLLFTCAFVVNIFIRIIGLSWTRFRKSAWDLYSLLAVFGSFITTILLLIDTNRNIYAQLHKLFLVSVVLLLIPRNNQLDQLFKTAAASFAGIANLLATWFVLFLVFAIALTQTFGLTRFGANETDNLNFRTVPKALIFLFRASMGEGWNQIMQDYATIVYPYCTIGERYYDGDCGSEAWARALFSMWNILSMYIFVNLFISLIYESFAYVYQRATRLSMISREEIRRFKQAWAEFDPNGSGFISKDVFPRFLGELSGVFEMRIYDEDFQVNRLIEDCRKDDTASRRFSALSLPEGSQPYEIDLKKLNARLAKMPVEQIQRRRLRLNTFYEEVLVSADPERGISFTAVLMILAHYKVIKDSKSLKLDEFLRRRARLQRVEEAVNRNIVIGFFDTLYWSRRFRRTVDGRKTARITAIPQFDIPEIFVQDDHSQDEQHDDHSRPSSRGMDIPSLSVTHVDGASSSVNEARDARQERLSVTSDTGHKRNTSVKFADNERASSISSPHLSVRHRPSPSASSIQPDWHFAAAIEGGTSPPASPGRSSFFDHSPSGDADDDPLSTRSRANSAVDPADMASALQHSAWGESVRRSFTHRRGGGGGGGGGGSRSSR